MIHTIEPVIAQVEYDIFRVDRQGELFMNAEKFEALKLMVLEETTVTKDNVMDMSLKIPNLHMKYLDIHSRENKILKKYELEFEQVQAKRFEFHKFYGPVKLSTKGEVDMFVQGDDEVAAKKNNMVAQSIVVDYLHSVVVGIGRMSFNIGQYIEFMKMKNGILT